MMGNSAHSSHATVTIIIPVYRGLQATRNCLESLIASNLPRYASVTIIDDCSPDEELSKYCREFTSHYGFGLIVNKANLGFVKSANKGFTIDHNSDVLLLNSDTMVFHDWLQRLQSCAYKERDIGTVTPFSNNGTICSYPVFPSANNLPAHWTAAELDKCFQLANAGMCAEIPTAVGFCMYIKRACLNETGRFDEDNFGLGYGEENDFSMRARALGWKHALAADVFVFHEGGASFASESSERKLRADSTMGELHPSYHQLVSDFIQADALYDLRGNVDAARLRDKPEFSGAILHEHSLYTRSLLERLAELRRVIVNEQEQRHALELVLSACRNQFAETDRALLQAEKVVEDLHKDIHNAQLYAEHLKEHIRNMEQSRSWRYTAWFRRK
jgi:GT2 family glycosyltransferase